jgi:hypothetical protein
MLDQRYLRYPIELICLGASRIQAEIKRYRNYRYCCYGPIQKDSGSGSPLSNISTDAVLQIHFSPFLDPKISSSGASAVRRRTYRTENKARLK